MWSLVGKHIELSRSYLQEASALLQAGQTPRVGHLLLNSMEEALKAVAASRGLNLRSESNTWDFATALASTMDDGSPVATAFNDAYFLYTDPYGYNLNHGQIQLLHEGIAAGVRELLDMAARSSNDDA